MNTLGASPESINNMTEVMFKNSLGEWPQLERVDQLLEFCGYSIGYFSDALGKGGTGFIIKAVSGSVDQCALVLTAAHIFIKEFHFEATIKYFNIENDKYYASPLKNDLQWDDLSKFLTDPVTFSKSSIPNDWVVCLISKIPGRTYISPLVPLKLCGVISEVSVGLDVAVYGFPRAVDLTSLKYAAPEANNSELTDIQHSLCGSLHMVKSYGKICAVGEMAAADCVTMNGMSGGPLIARINGELVVIGFLHGGPASPIHFYAAQLLHSHLQARISIIHEFIQYAQQNLKPSITINNCCALLSKALNRTLTLQDSNFLKLLLMKIYAKATKYEGNSGRLIHHNNFYLIPIIFSELEKIMNAY